MSVQYTHADILWANEASGTRSDQNSTGFAVMRLKALVWHVNMLIGMQHLDLG